MKQLIRKVAMLLMALCSVAQAQDHLPYTTYTSFSQVLEGSNARYFPIIRVSDLRPGGQPAYTGFFFYQCLQFDPTERYLLGMRVNFQNRLVKPTDRAEIGFVDLKDGYKWTKIGETTAWNWQQGARLQWRPRSDEIVWNSRSEDGKKYVCMVYNFRTGRRRALPRPVYDLSPDGTTALTHDFERMKHRGTDYVGIEDRFKDQYAPADTGIWKMNMDSGHAELIMSLERMASIAYPDGHPPSGCLYFFREGWNPSGKRFIAFLKDPENELSRAFSMEPDGADVRYLYSDPSHHSWQDDEHVLDFGHHTLRTGSSPLGGYFLFKDDGTGEAKDLLWNTDYDGHNSYIPGPGGDWILSDTYDIGGFQYLFMYHRRAKLFVPIAKLKNHAPEGIHRVDLHPRVSRDGRMISIDSTYEDLGRQMYIIDIGQIVDNPPRG
jgi:hypothetical protein